MSPNDDATGGSASDATKETPAKQVKAGSKGSDAGGDSAPAGEKRTVKGPVGTQDAQAPARPTGSRPAGRTVTARQATPPPAATKVTAAVPVPTKGAAAASGSQDASPVFTPTPGGGKGSTRKVSSGRSGRAARKVTAPAKTVAPTQVDDEAAAAVAPKTAVIETAKKAATPPPAPVTAAATAPVVVPVPTGSAPTMPVALQPAEEETQPVAVKKASKSAVSGSVRSVGGPGGERKFKVSITRVSPWSVMKLSFLLSVAFGIMLVVAFYLFWVAMDKAGVFVTVNDLIVEVAGENFFNLLDFVQFDTVMSFAVLLAVADIVILTLLSTLFAVVYNLVANLVGGMHITLADD